MPPRGRGGQAATLKALGQILAVEILKNTENQGVLLKSDIRQLSPGISPQAPAGRGPRKPRAPKPKKRHLGAREDGPRLLKHWAKSSLSKHQKTTENQGVLLKNDTKQWSPGISPQGAGPRSAAPSPGA